VSDIFISYSNADRARIRPLVDALTRRGWSVWWDRTIPPGKTWDRMIEDAIRDARCVIVLWSKDSIESDWVRNEAEEGKRKGILVPALIDPVGMPLEFRRIQAANLVGWSEAAPNPEFDEFLRAVADLLARNPALPEASAPAVPAPAAVPVPPVMKPERWSRSRFRYASIAMVGLLSFAGWNWYIAPYWSSPSPAPLLAAGRPADWWFVYKFNAASFPGCGNNIERSCPFGGEPQSYREFGQQFAYVSSADGVFRMGRGCAGATTADPLGATFNQVYNGSPFYVVWNDQLYGDPLKNASSPSGHSKGLLAWDRNGSGFVLQSSTPSWPASGSSKYPRKTDGNTLGCLKDNDLASGQHFFALKLNRQDVVLVLKSLANANVVTDPEIPQLVRNGGPAEIQSLVKGLGTLVISRQPTRFKLSSGVTLISKPADLNVPPWQMVSALLGGEPLRAATWWLRPQIPTTTAETPVKCWDPSLGSPGAVEIATSGTVLRESLSFHGGATPDSNHAKIGVSTGAQPYSIFGDLNQQGYLEGDHCNGGQNGRGGLFYVVDDTNLRARVRDLIRGDTAPANQIP
jgi:TIR domain/Deoxyribonuclease II